MQVMNARWVGQNAVDRENAWRELWLEQYQSSLKKRANDIALAPRMPGKLGDAQNLEVRALLKEDIVVQESALQRLQDAHAQLMVTVQDIWRVAREREAALAGQLALLQEGMQTLEYRPSCESRLRPNCPSPTSRDRRRFWK